ncbi:peptide chain release factor [Sinobacterium caligoides]|uniref:Peptide chain release factor n=1 Tax=Sinobacterium caligoides TaxID=933926 RepID=A0A3N2DNE2_9GAMM|nr:peptide chain release factor H [Sinobacterium caligoides]ROS01323.1 peptide chain release factor [Sinobacterium caligoides]
MTSCWLQLTAGQGPKECGWVVAQLCRVMSVAAQQQRLSFDVVESMAYDKVLRQQDLIVPDAFRSILVRVEGDGAQSFVRDWQGVIKWQGESHYRRQHKRMNWYVAVLELDVAGNKVIEMEALKREVSIQTMRSTGPGGQHVNKTSSAVRVTHRPTGLQIRVESDRSQHRNKKLALERLQILLMEGISNEQQMKNKQRWLSHYQVQRGKPKRRFHGPNFEECRGA